MDTKGVFYQSFTSNQGRYSVEDTQCIERVVSKLDAMQTSESRPGMLLGKIQSGKTKTFMAVIGLSFDNQFEIAVILTKGTKALAKQTYARVKQEFYSHVEEDRMQVFDIMTVPALLTPYELNQKLVFVVKKQIDNLEKLIQIFDTKYPQLKGRRVLVIDDEADYASVGFRKSEGEVDANTTTHQLETLREKVPKAAFLQVTATPYALYLQPSDFEVHGKVFKPVRPAFTELVPVHSDYVGSDYYFNESLDESSLASYLYHPLTVEELTALRKPDGRKIKTGDVLNSKAIPALRSAVCNFLVGACIRRLQETYQGNAPKKFSFLVHTEAGKEAHTWQETVVESIVVKLNELSELNSIELDQLLQSSYSEIVPSLKLMNQFIPEFKDVLHSVKKLLADGSVMITKVNSEKDIESLLADDGQLKLRTPLNIFIGGQILDRGITISNLIGFYYGRRPNVFQQDTVLQHSRMFGFRPKADLAVTRFYTEPTIYAAMRRMHESDIALREQLSKNSDHDVVFIQKDRAGVVIPCSPNKVMLSNTTTLKPFKRILPVGFQTVSRTKLLPVTQKIDNELDRLNISGDFEDPFLISTEEALKLIDLIEPTIEMFKEEGYDFDWQAAKSALEYLSSLSSSESSKNVWCLVRKDRNINRILSIGSHAQYADAPDSTKTEGRIRKEFSKDKPMIALIRQNGLEENGWRGAPFYWPVITAQANVQTTIFSHESQAN